MKISSYLLAAVAVAVLSLGGGAPYAEAQVTGPEDHQETAPVNSALVSAVNRFSQTLYAHVAERREGNLAVSPLGSNLLLAMLLPGAEGATQREIRSVLALPRGRLSELGELIALLDGTESLTLAQRIYLADSLELSRPYTAALAPLPLEPPASFPTGNGEQAASMINAWVEDRTRGLIKNFLPPLDPKAFSVLVSVLHFKGEWQHQFAVEDTRPEPFHSPEGTVSVPMMSLVTRPAGLLELPGARGVALAYEEGFDMLFILPEQGRSLDTLERGLELTTIKETPSGRKVRVEIPRFEFEVPTFSLDQAWEEMGLRRTLNDPQLSSMFSPAPKTPLELEVFHKTYIKVDEVGTEAAAATGGVIQPTSAAMPALYRFDRPFLFVLRHRESGVVLMIGRVEKPAG